MKTKILIIDDVVEDHELFKFSLADKFSLSFTLDGKNGIQSAKLEKPDLILLDIGLPDIDGLEVCKYLKENIETKNIPIFIISCHQSNTIKVKALEQGAEDYLSKPFDYAELQIRIKNILKRSGISGFDEITDGDITLNLSKFKVSVNNKEIKLTVKEFDLLYVLIKNKDKVLKRDYLLERVWGYEVLPFTRTVDVHVRRLRQKLGKAGDYIKTIVSYGYKWER